MLSVVNKGSFVKAFCSTTSTWKCQWFTYARWTSPIKKYDQGCIRLTTIENYRTSMPINSNPNETNLCRATTSILNPFLEPPNDNTPFAAIAIQLARSISANNPLMRAFSETLAVDGCQKKPALARPKCHFLATNCKKSYK